MMFFPVNVIRTHWQVMAIVNATEEIKETEVLFFDSYLRSFDPRKNYQINCITGQDTEELEVHFLKRHLAAILTQDRFLAAITTDHFTPRTITPEIKKFNSVQKIYNDCGL